MFIIECSSARQIFFLHFLNNYLELSILERRLLLLRRHILMFRIYVSLEVSITLEYLVATTAFACLRVVGLFDVLVKSFIRREIIATSYASKILFRGFL